MTHYCHNCLCWSELADGTYCHFCLDAFARLGRLPRKSDPALPASSMARVYAVMGWNLPS